MKISKAINNQNYSKAQELINQKLGEKAISAINDRRNVILKNLLQPSTEDGE